MESVTSVPWHPMGEVRIPAFACTAFYLLIGSDPASMGRILNDFSDFGSVLDNLPIIITAGTNSELVASRWKSPYPITSPQSPAVTSPLETVQ